MPVAHPHAVPVDVFDLSRTRTAQHHGACPGPRVAGRLTGELLNLLVRNDAPHDVLALSGPVKSLFVIEIAVAVIQLL